MQYPINGHLLEIDGSKLIIGLVGGPGCGKSTIAKFASQYADVISVDEMIDELIERLKPIISLKWPDIDVSKPAGEVRQLVSKKVFSNQVDLAWWEGESFECLMTMIANRINASNNKVVLIDYALLNYAHMDIFVDLVICVEASLSTQLERVSSRGWDQYELGRRMARFQHTLHGDLYIKNDGDDIGMLEFNVGRIFRSFHKTGASIIEDILGE